MMGGTAAAFMLGGVLHGLGMGLAYPLLYALLTKAAGDDSRTSLFTLFGTFVDLLWAVAPLVAAAAAQFAGFGPVLRGMSVLIAAVVLFMQVRVWPVLRRED